MIVRRDLAFVGFVFESPSVRTFINRVDAPEAILDISHSQWRTSLIVFDLRVEKIQAWNLEVEDAMFTRCQVPGGIEALNARLRRATFNECQTQSLNLIGTEILGNLFVIKGKVTDLSFGTSVLRSTFISDTDIGSVYLQNTRVEDGVLQIERTRIGTLNLFALQLRAPFRLLDVLISERVIVHGLEQHGTHGFVVERLRFIPTKVTPDKRERLTEVAALLRIAKKRAVDLGDPHRGDYYLQERLWMFRALPLHKKLAELPGRLWMYGEKPLRFFLGMIMAVIVYALVYWLSSGLRRSEGPANGLIDALYFSGITFTTLGYGDIAPSPSSFLRLVAISEALLGAVSISAFVVAIAKKYTRE